MNADQLAELLRVTVETRDKVQELTQWAEQHQEEERKTIERILSGFPTRPDGSPDLQSHADYHAAKIEEAKAMASFFRDLRGQLVKGTIRGFFYVVILLVVFWWSHQIPAIKP